MTILKSPRALLLARSAISVAAPSVIRSHGRAKVRDVAFTYRMGAGFAGDVNRTHPFDVFARLNDPLLPVLGYGLAVVFNAAGNGVRNVQAGDAAATLIGVSVRPFPLQTRTGGDTSNFGAATPPAGAIDVLSSGAILVQLPAGQVPVLGGAAYVWTAASAGAHVQGGFESVNPGGNGVQFFTTAYAYFNGGPDANGIAELIMNP